MRRHVRVSIPLDLVVAAERELLALFREAVPAFKLTRAVFVAILFEDGWLNLVEDRHVGKGKDRRLVPGPDREQAMRVAQSYVESLLEARGEPIYGTRARRRRAPRRAR